MPRILLVDADERSNALYAHLLESEGYGVRAASSAAEALRAFDRESFDLAVLESRIPGMDGLETMETMLSKDPAVLIVFHTTDASLKDNFWSWFADAFIVKSDDISVLLSTVRTLLATRPSRQQRFGADSPRMEPFAPLPSVAGGKRQGGAP